MKEKNAALKMLAAHSLALRGLQADVVLPIFIDGLKNEEASVRRQAAEAIARYGPKARQARPTSPTPWTIPDDSVRPRPCWPAEGRGCQNFAARHDQGAQAKG